MCVGGGGRGAIANYLKYETVYFLMVCGGGRGGGGASCSKLHGASCNINNINKFINFVKSVRPKKAIPYTGKYGC